MHFFTVLDLNCWSLKLNVNYIIIRYSFRIKIRMDLCYKFICISFILLFTKAYESLAQENKAASSMRIKQLRTPGLR